MPEVDLDANVRDGAGREGLVAGKQRPDAPRHDRRAIIRIYDLLVTVPILVYLGMSIADQPNKFLNWQIFVWAGAVALAELLPVPTNVSMGFSLSFPLEL